MLFAIYLIDPGPFPEYDEQIHWHLPWAGWSIPGGRWLGEWAWVGRHA